MANLEIREATLTELTRRVITTANQLQSLIYLFLLVRFTYSPLKFACMSYSSTHQFNLLEFARLLLYAIACTISSFTSFYLYDLLFISLSL